MFCSKCGNAVAPDSTFCTICGTPQVRTALPSPASAAVSVPPNVGVAGYSSTARGQFLYGGFWLRFVALIIDSVLTGIVIFAIFVPIALMTGAAAHLEVLRDASRHGQMDPAIAAAIISVVFLFAGLAILIGWLYEAYFESSSWQATIGKRVMNIYVTDLNGQPVTFLNATGRHFAKIITGLLPVFIGYIMAAFTERRQALHDMIASTLVLRR